MSLKLTILGCDSAIPTINKHQTAQLLNINERFFLIDCGENTQVQLRKYELSFQRIHHVFISHLHGDHYFGLIGLITSMHLLGRKKELHIYAHSKLKEIINIQLSASNTDLNYPLFFHVLAEDSEVVLYKDDSVEISNILLNHTINCSGFIFREIKYKRKIIKNKIQEFNIPYDKIIDLKNGLDFISENGNVISNDLMTSHSSPPKSYAYCSDTSFFSEIISKIRGVDLLYHEATFCHDLKERALETGHSTTRDAATIAKEANVKRLMLGHYSKRYSDLNDLLLESRDVFPNTFLSKSGDTIDFNDI